MASNKIEPILFFLRWQLYPIVISIPSHLGFVFRGLGNSRTRVAPRIKIATRCVGIHLRLRCGHNPTEALHIVEDIIELPPGREGVVVECGAYLGGSTAKLSQAAAIVGRELIVCDSFEGLPEVAVADHTDVKPDFQKGEYAGRLDEVKKNVTRYGDISRVRFVQGWYENSLGQLADTPIACAFWDVDLQESFTTCIKALWKNLQPDTKVFLHDVDRPPVVEVFTNTDWWRKEMGIDPPQFLGAYKGLGRRSPLIGYVVKT
jgi:O-methyltransferase